MIPKDISDAIQRAAGANGIDSKLIYAIVLQESMGNPWLTRYEPNWKYFYYPEFFSKTNHVTTETETIMQATSWGLMQIMGSSARELGFASEMTKLISPDTSLLFGCKKIKQLSAKCSNQNDLIASYNAGSVRKNTDGTYVNQDYVNAVNKFYNAGSTKVLQ